MLDNSAFPSKTSKCQRIIETSSQNLPFLVFHFHIPIFNNPNKPTARNINPIKHNLTKSPKHPHNSNHNGNRIHISLPSILSAYRHLPNISPTMPSSSPRVLVTGCTGFIATSVIAHLLQTEHTVHATHRASTVNSSNMPLFYKTYADSVRMFQTELTTPPSLELIRAATGCDYAVHLASPTEMDAVRDARIEIIDPAIQATNAVLTACQRAGVSRVIVVSSHTAIAQDGRREKGKLKFTEEDWNDKSTVHHLPFYYSKVQAERVAWNFSKYLQLADASSSSQRKGEAGEQEQEENNNGEVSAQHVDAKSTSWLRKKNVKSSMQVIAVNPATVWGPSLHTMSTLPDMPGPATHHHHEQKINNEQEQLLKIPKSKELLLTLARGDLPGIIDLSFPIVHVRDVARSIVHLLHSPTAQGRYIICPSEELVHMRDIVDTMYEMGVTSVNRRDLTNFAFTRAIKVASHFSPGGQAGQYIRANLGNSVRLDSRRLHAEVGNRFMFTDVSTIVRESVQELMDQGWVHNERLKAYRVEIKNR